MCSCGTATTQRCNATSLACSPPRTSITAAHVKLPCRALASQVLASAVPVPVSVPVPAPAAPPLPSTLPFYPALLCTELLLPLLLLLTSHSGSARSSLSALYSGERLSCKT